MASSNACTAVLDVSRDTVEHLARLLHQHRGTRSYQGLLAYLIPAQACPMSLVQEDLESVGRAAAYSEPRPHDLGES